MAITTNVPSNNFEDLQRDVQDATRFANATAPFTNRVGHSITPIPVRDSQLAAKVAEAASAVEALGWFPVSGSFTDGGTITARNQVLFNDADSSFYSWSGALPKVVPAASTPASAGGVSANAWVNRGDAALRNALAAPNSTVPVGGVEAGLIASRVIDVRSFGLIGDGVTPNDAALAAMFAAVQGKTVAFPNGVYRFNGNISFNVPVIMLGGVLLGPGFVSFNAGLTAGDYHFLQMRLGNYNGKVNARWYGARGSNAVETPNSTGFNVESAPWNTWDGTLFKDDPDWSPYYGGGSFNPPRNQPFKNTDTWDYIGINMALWFGGSAYVPKGIYKVDLSNSAKSTYRGLITMRGMEQTITGDGRNDTIIETAEGPDFFESTDVGVLGQFKLYTQYRNGGPPTIVKDIWFRGPTGYNSISKNLTLIAGVNINGITVQDCWLTTASRGWSLETSSGDSFLTNTTTEFLFDDSAYADASSELWVRDCNIWSSANIIGQRGINADGFVRVSDTKFRDFRGESLKAASAQVDGCEFTSSNNPDIAIDVGKLRMAGGRVDLNSSQELIRCGAGSSLGGGLELRQTSNNPCLNLGDGTAGSAVDVLISGVTFIKTDGADQAQNVAIIAVQQGVSFTGAATPSVFVTGCIFRGRAMQSVGSATIKNNVFDGAYVI